MPNPPRPDPLAGAALGVPALERRYGRSGTEALRRLRAAAERPGGLTAADVRRVARELRVPRAHLHGAASFFSDLAARPRELRHVRLCAGTACLAAGAGPHLDEVEEAVRAAGASCQRVYCIGCCYASPAALDGERACAGPQLGARLPAGDAPAAPPIPFAADVPDPVVLAGLAGSGPEPWPVYRAALEPGGRERLLTEVRASGLRGRGGAGFPAARKWEAAASSAGDGARYVIANGDEGDPGSFADRLLMESDPHRVLAGLALAGLAVGAARGFVYVRSEYPAARDALRAAVGDARRAGHLGQGFDVDVVEGAGSYVAGEETSLIRSMEGLRGGAVRRPPFPAEHGLYGRPTAVNNVETLAAVPWIAERGGAAYGAIGAGESSGTMLVCLNERFARPGAYEVALGVTLRHICHELGGGLRDGRELRALQVGGPLGGFLGPGQLDTPLTFEGLAAAGAALGHGGIVALDERVSARDVLHATWRFAADESCGNCFPCRIGSRRGLELAEAEAAGRRDPGAEAALLEALEDGSLCAFGQSVPPVVRSLRRAYAEELAP